MLKLVTVPNTILSLTTKSVITFDANLRNLVQQMEQILIAQQDPPGVGLAAPQIGVNMALFIIKPTAKAKIEVFINPRIIESEILNSKSQINSKSKMKNSKPKRRTPLEGCLSIPRIWGPIKRNKQLLLEYQSIKGEKKTEWFKGFKAVIIQHEIDHLNGILFTQRALEQNAPLYEETDGELKRLDSSS